MTSCKRGDVVLVPFPFTDLSSAKQRPALVTSADAWNAAQSDVVLVALTSHMTGPRAPGDYVLTVADLHSGGLPKPSLVRTTKIFTMHQGLLRRTLGHLPDSATSAVLSELRQFFA
jgi:mRNA interferase MazF